MGDRGGREHRVLHVNDCASTTTQLVAEAHRVGLPWRYLPLAGDGRSWEGAGGRALKVAAGASWAPRLAASAARADALHVHYASVARHTRWTRRPFVLHCHGTDVRSQQYEPRWTAPIRSALAAAVAVAYSTPDLAEHVLPHRADARYVPVPLDLSVLPRWSPPAGAPQVLFASRWEPVKGLAAQLETAAALRRALPAEVEVAGLDWGPGADDAARAGVRLLPRADRAAYLRLLAGASVVVGQASGMLAASELEAVGTGAPVVAGLSPRWYPSGEGPAPAVLGGTAAWAGGGPAVEALVEGVRRALADPVTVSGSLGGPAWLASTHDVRSAVQGLRALYRDVLG